ncbi:MAG: PLP-dependent aminotransferase family protein [Candidatus Sulfotelmatobacter sp.]
MKRATGTVLNIDLEFSKDESLHRQLYLAIKRAILEGRLHPRDPLPSTRTIANDFHLSRTTVLNAFEQLSAEGYLEGRTGSGTRVSSYIPGDLARVTRRQVRSSNLKSSSRISQRAQMDDFYDLSFLRPPSRPLRPGQPEIGLFPREIWSRLAAKHWRRANRDPEHIDSLGYRPLRQAICEYVGRLRGVRCSPDQVLIVCGAQQALFLAAYALADAGETVWIEDPGYPRARMAFLSAGLKVVPVPVDSDGLMVSEGITNAPRPKLVFVTPSFQCPLGITLSLQRRFELLQLAEQQEAWVLEDDYFSEYRYGGAAVASLQSIDKNERVIYIGNFSKSVALSLRIGYMIVPPSLIGHLKDIRSSMSRQPPGLEQAILAEFLMEGHLERHLRATLRVYRERQEALVDAIRHYGSGLMETSVSGTGMYLVAWLNSGIDDRVAAQSAAKRGVDIIPLSAFCIKPLLPRGIVLGYSAYEPARIRSAVIRLCSALSDLKLRRIRAS